MLAQLPAQIASMGAALAAQLKKKRTDELAATHAELMSQLDAVVCRREGAESRQWDDRIDKLTAGLVKEGKLTADNQELLLRIRMAGQARIDTERDKALAQSTDDLKARLAGQGDATLALEEQQFTREIDQLQQGLKEKYQLTAENQTLIEQLRAAGLERLARRIESLLSLSWPGYSSSSLRSCWHR